MKNIEKIVEREKEIEPESCNCPCFGECAGIYGCPKDYKDCLEYSPKQFLR